MKEFTIEHVGKGLLMWQLFLSLLLVFIIFLLFKVFGRSKKDKSSKS